MMTAISPLAKLLAGETPAAAGTATPPAGAERFAAMLSGAVPAPATGADAAAAQSMPTTPGAPAAKDMPLMTVPLAPSLVATASPLAVPQAATPQAARSASVSETADKPAQPDAAAPVVPDASAIAMMLGQVQPIMPVVPAAPTPTPAPAASTSVSTTSASVPPQALPARFAATTGAAASQPAPLSAEEMASLAPALQLLAEHAAADPAVPMPAAAPTPVSTLSVDQPVVSTAAFVASVTPPAVTPQVPATAQDVPTQIAAVAPPQPKQDQPVATAPAAPQVDEPVPATARSAPQRADGATTQPTRSAPDTVAILSARASAKPVRTTPADRKVPAGSDTGKTVQPDSPASIVASDLPAAKPVAATPDTPQVAPTPARAEQVAQPQAQPARAEAAPRAPARKAEKAAPAVEASAATSVATTAGPTSQAQPAADAAGQQLAQGAADRQLDLAKSNAWLDGISRDIATTGDANGTLRFQVAPQQLGAVSVAVTRGEDGASVTLTAASDKARDLLADARPQLIAEAQANGFRIASAQVDVSTQQQSADQGRSGQQAQHQPHQPAAQQAQSGGSSAFAESSMGSGEGGRQPQTRSQLLSDTPQANPFRGAASADSADDASATDGLYA